MKRIAVLLAALFVLPACTVGHIERDIGLDRDLDGSDLLYIARLRSERKADPHKAAEIEIRVAHLKVSNKQGDRSRYRWIFPFFAERKTLVVSGPTVAISTAYEAPAIFPGITFFLGLRHNAGTCFNTSTGVARVKASVFEVNPLVRFARSKEKHVTRGWEVTLGKGLLGVGSSVYGPYVQLLWFLKLGEGGYYSHQNLTETRIRPIKPAEPETGGLARELTGSVLQFLLFH